MRTLPDGWPADSADQTLFDVYVHVLDSSWPPASTLGGEPIPAGWAVVADWEIVSELSAPLLPGQINSDLQVSAATGYCTIAQPTPEVYAPWAASDLRPPSSARLELVASRTW
jgi:hypothetical protein